MIQIKIFGGVIAHEEELERAANKFMQGNDIEVIDVTFHMQTAPGDEENIYHGYSVVMVKYRQTDK